MALLRRGETWTQELQLHRRDGTALSVLTTNAPVFDEQGKLAAIIGVGVDLTERKQTEAVFRFLGQCGTSGSSEGFFPELARYLAQTMDMNFVCIDRLEEGRLAAQTLAVFHNGRFEDNVSYALKDTPCGDVVGKTDLLFSPERAGAVPQGCGASGLAGGELSWRHVVERAGKAHRPDRSHRAAIHEGHPAGGVDPASGGGARGGRTGTHAGRNGTAEQPEGLESRPGRGPRRQLAVECPAQRTAVVRRELAHFRRPAGYAVDLRDVSRHPSSRRPDVRG